MRQEYIKRLKTPYTEPRVPLDRRFHSAIGADIPSATKLVRAIFGDLDTVSFGISWWSSVPTEQRILIGDYLFQCVNGIELNLAEARLHHLEWLDVRDKQDGSMADIMSHGLGGEAQIKMPPSKAAIDDLPNKLEGLHVCGFFRGVGSTLDCIGAAIIGVLGLNSSLRRSDIAKAERDLLKLKATGTPGSQLQLDFRDFFIKLKADSGPEDWLEWTDQYRNMFVHRGRRNIYNQLMQRETRLLDSQGEIIPRVTSTMHLAKYPDKSDAEAMMRKGASLNEDADATMSGIFKSVRDLTEAVCERLGCIWQERRSNPSLIHQPPTQWDTKIRSCNFIGYDKSAQPLGADTMISSGVLQHRLFAAALDNAHRYIWANSPWK